MRFYYLNDFPRGDAATDFSTPADWNVGDAESCLRCGATISLLKWLPPLRAELELRGSRFGDFVFGVGCDFLASQRFCDVYRDFGLTGLHGFDPVEIVGVKSRRRKLPKPPEYFRVYADYDGTTLDFGDSGFEWFTRPTCPVCWSALIVRWKRVVVRMDTWNGDDAFVPRGFPGTTMVTQRFKDACELNTIHNAVFLPAETYGHDYYPSNTEPTFKAGD